MIRKSLGAMQVLSRDMKGIIISDGNCLAKDWYEEHRKYIMTQGSPIYGAVLIITKIVKIGFEVNFQFCSLFTSLKPRLRYHKSFEWLWFIIRFEWKYYNKFDHIVKDFLGEKIESQ